MARYDKDTEAFIKQISDAPTAPQKEPEKSDDTEDLRRPFRIARQVSKIVSKPESSLGRLLVRSATKALMEKGGSIGILKLYQFMNDHYDREWWDWEPETIWKSLEDDHLDGEGSTPEELKSAVMALQLCVSSMAAYEHWHIFEKVGHAFNWNHVDFSILQPLEPDEAALAAAILKRIQPKAVLEDEVLSYIAVCAKVAGMVYLPAEIIPGAQDRLSEITFEYELRDATKKAWEDKTLPKDDILRSQVDLQLSRLQEVKDLMDKEGVSA